MSTVKPSDPQILWYTYGPGSDQGIVLPNLTWVWFILAGTGQINKTHGNTLVKIIELAKRLFFICSPVTKVLKRIVKSR